MNLLKYKAGVIFMVVFVVSCIPTKQLKYFNDINEIEEPGVNPRTQKIIAPFDKLYIKVFSIDPKTLAIFNTADEMRYGSGTNGVIGYLVDDRLEHLVEIKFIPLKKEQNENATLVTFRSL
jgi:hypothetical protein